MRNAKLIWSIEPSSIARARSRTSLRSGLQYASEVRPSSVALSSSVPALVRAIVVPRWFSRNATSGDALRVVSNAPRSTISVYGPQKSYISYGCSTVDAIPWKW